MLRHFLFQSRTLTKRITKVYPSSLFHHDIIHVFCYVFALVLNVLAGEKPPKVGSSYVDSLSTLSFITYLYLCYIILSNLTKLAAWASRFLFLFQSRSQFHFYCRYCFICWHIVFLETRDGAKYDGLRWIERLLPQKRAIQAVVVVPINCVALINVN